MIYLKRHYYLLIIAVVGLLVYSNTLHVPFVFDGEGQVRDNPMIKELDNFRLALAGRHFSRSEGYLYVPSRLVGYLSFGLNYHFGKLDVMGYHLTNLAIHLCSAVLVYFLVLLTFSTPLMHTDTMPRDPPLVGKNSRTAGLLALFTSLLFVSHPVQTEAVTYIVQRFASLATMFYLLSLVAYIKGRLSVKDVVTCRLSAEETESDHDKAAEGARGAKRSVCRPVAFFCVSLLSAVLAMRTKEISFTLPIVIVIYEFLFFSVPLGKRLVFLVPALMTLSVIPLALIGVNEPISQVLSDVVGRTRLVTSILRTDYLLTQARVVTTYIRLLLFPVGQNLDYDYPVYHSLLAPPVLLSSFFLLSIMGLAVYLIHKSRQARSDKRQANSCQRSAISNRLGEEANKQQAASGKKHADPLSRTSNLQTQTSNPLPIASYYRLAGFGIIWFFVTLSVTSSIIPIIDVIFEHRMYLPSVGAFLAITALGFAMAERLNLSGRKRGRAAIALFSLLVIIFSVAAYSRNAVWGTAMGLWEDTVAKSPNKARPHNNLGEAYYKHNRLDEATRELKTALKLKPDYAITHNNLGSVFAAKGLLMRAKDEFQIATTLQPSYEDAYYNLGQVCSLMGLTDQAIREFQAALKLNPSDAAAHNRLGKIYYRQNRLDEATREFQAALRLKPDYAIAHNNLGSVFAAKGLLMRAKDEFQTAVNLSPGYEGAHYNLAEAFLLMGRRDQATREFQAALRLNPSDTAALKNLKSLQGR